MCSSLTHSSYWTDENWDGAHERKHKDKIPQLSSIISHGHPDAATDTLRISDYLNVDLAYHFSICPVCCAVPLSLLTVHLHAPYSLSLSLPILRAFVYHL